MNDKLHNRLLDLRIYYLPIVIFNCFITGFLFFLFPAALLVTIMVNIVLLYAYLLIEFLGGLFILLVVLSFFTNKITIDTFKNYGDRSTELNYPRIYVILNLISFVSLLTIFIITYIIINKWGVLLWKRNIILF